MGAFHTEVLILGAGAAGIRAALAAHESGAEVTMVAKTAPVQGGSSFSALSKGWGIQGLVGEERTEKNLEDFYDDIMDVGLGVQDSKLVRILVEESGPRIEDLISYGICFKKDIGRNFLRLKGCFSDHPRAFITADFSNVRDTFLSILRRIPVRLVTGSAVELIMVDGTCWGAQVITNDNNMLNIIAKASILASGGGAGIYEHHLVDADQVGDGYGLAHRAGAELKNMEFVQFMLGLKANGTRYFLPLAKLRQPQIILDQYGNDLIENCMPDSRVRKIAIDERQGHLPFSSRDSSCQIDLAVARTANEGQKVLWKDNGSNDESTEVVHFAHAFNGGIAIDDTAESTVPGLFAAGEVVAGPHGADRIGGCMMTATQVFGRRAGHFAAKRAKMLKQCPSAKGIIDTAAMDKQTATDDDVIHAVEAVQTRVNEAMGRWAAVLRNQKGLKKCLEILDTCQLHLSALDIFGIADAGKYFSLRNMILTANLVVQSALARKESKGPHFLQDGCRS